jgi:6-phosphogluconolactonase
MMRRELVAKSRTRVQVKIVADNAALAHAAAQEFHRLADEAVQKRGRFSVALSGGNTPRSVNSLLATEHRELPWDRIHVFFGDERAVPPEHPDSNFRMASESLLAHVPIPDANIHRIRAELEPETAARDYQDQLRDFFHLNANSWPRFDLVLLGLGEDGHTASLFPGTSALHETVHTVVANWVERLSTFRITLTYPVLNHSSDVIFLVAGEAKAQILTDVLKPGEDRYPAQLVLPEEGRVLWLADQEAARLLRFATPPTP